LPNHGIGGGAHENKNPEGEGSERELQQTISLATHV
jgi:hypothetical protein